MYSGPQQQRVFSGAMDQDSAPWAIKSPNYRYALNLDNSVSDGQTGSPQNIPSDALVNNPLLRPGRNKVIGTFEDIPGATIIYLVWNSLGYHSIFRWFSARVGYPQGVIEKVFEVGDPSRYNSQSPDPLNFKEDSRITGITLRNGTLFFNDPASFPKAIDIEKANETDKPRQFRVYLNRQALQTPAVAYLVDVYLDGAGVETIAWGGTASDLAGRLQEMQTGLQGAISFHCEVTDSYATITMRTPGRYFVKMTGLSLYPDRVLPYNFYPDYTNLGANSYPALPSGFFNRVKFPPFCAPDAQYVADPDTDFANVQLGTVAPPAPIPGAINIRGWLGFDSNVNNIAGLVVTNGPSNYSATFTNPIPGAFLSATSPVTVNIRIRFTFAMGALIASQTPSFHFCRYNAFTLPFPPATPLLLIPAPPLGTSGTYNVDVSTSITINPGEEWGIYMRDIGNGAVVSGGVINIEQGAAGAIEPTEVARKALMFRVKNIYDRYAGTVYSMSTPVILSTFQFTQDRINIDLWEKWVEEVSWCSTLLEKVIAVSEDGGTSWNEVKTLLPHEFVCENDSTYSFTGKEGYIPISEAVAIEQYHDVSLRALALEGIDNRLWDMGLEKGYDKIPVNFTLAYTFKATDQTEVTTDQASVECFRPGWKGYIGIVYGDDADRKTGVCLCPNSYFEFPSYQEGDMNDPGFVYGLRMYINNAPPAWATKYWVVRTKDLSQNDYLLWTTNTIATVDDQGNSPAVTTAVYWRIGIDNIGPYVNTAERGAIIEYTFAKGDRIKFIAPASTLVVPAGTLYDAEIMEVDDQYIYIAYNSALSNVAQIVEIYSPASPQDVSSLKFYEMGICHEVLSGTFNGLYLQYHQGDPVYTNAPGVNADQDYNPAPIGGGTPAILETYHGGAYARLRNMLYSGLSIRKKVLIWSNYANEFFASKFDGLYRPNTTTLRGRTWLGEYGQFSNQNQSDRIFAYNAMAAGDIFWFDKGLGDGVKLIASDNNTLKVIFSNSYQASIYVNQGVIRQSQGGGNIVSVSDQVAGNTNIIQRSLGTLQPESVAINDEADVFGWDEKSGDVWRSSGNGLIPVSGYGMKNTFNRYGLERSAMQGAYSQAPAVYDIYRDQYIITLLPVVAKAAIKSYAEINIGELSSALSYDVSTLRITPAGIYLYNNVPSTDISADIIASVSTIPGWSAVVNEFGVLVITAPDETYNGQELTLSIDSGTTKIYKYYFKGGAPATAGTSTSGYTLAFTKGKNGWPTYYSFQPECYGRMRNRIALFQDGQMYLYREGTGYNNFLGTQFGSIMRYVINEAYPKVKVMLSQWLRSKGRFGAILSAAPSDTYPTGQRTEMTPAHFRLEEDGYYAEVLRNQLYLTPEFPILNQAWVNGEPLRGDTMDVELYCNETSQVRLDSAKNLYFYSENS